MPVALATHQVVVRSCLLIVENPTRAIPELTSKRNRDSKEIILLFLYIVSTSCFKATVSELHMSPCLVIVRDCVILYCDNTVMHLASMPMAADDPESLPKYSHAKLTVYTVCTIKISSVHFEWIWILWSLLACCTFKGIESRSIYSIYTAYLLHRYAAYRMPCSLVQGTRQTLKVLKFYSRREHDQVEILNIISAVLFM